MIIDETNYEVANNATRDILFMYRDMIECYGGFGGTIDTGSFDALAFLDFSVHERPGTTLGIDVELVQQGSAVAILLKIHDAWCKGDGEILPRSTFTDQVREALDRGRFDHLGVARAALDAGLKSLELFLSRLPAVYDAYVLGYFRRLLASTARTG